MCITSNFIELQAYQIYEEIRKETIYKLVWLENSEGRMIQLNNIQSYWDGQTLLTKAFLEDINGKLYIVNINNNGLSFAKGEISYKAYRRLEKSENRKGIIFFSMLVFLTMITMFTLEKLLLNLV
ncbi:hypothetical protein SAMN05880501_108103 [Ureibacillus xyleni]|uniref:Uncharacterized protein n=1 Tax=Ureibacillus xyleni TaxID=614648 RepID=A0A285T326_9BACL|nr:hypothetical protein [Ureibacillus xyleni]SOC15531.1 hypothetical protein SAMN05880501_108103 [Ureibacillus xyleni]